MQVTVFGKTYNFANAPKFARHAIRLITRRWGSTLAKAPAFVKHRAYDLARQFGTLG